MDTTRETNKGRTDDFGKTRPGQGASPDAAKYVTDRGATGSQQGGEQGGLMHTVADKAKDAASTVAEYAGQAKDAVTDFAGHAKERVEHMASGAAESMGHAKDAVVGWTSDAAHTTGHALGAANDEVTTLIRRYPIPALLVGVGIGFLLAQALRR